MTLADSAIAQNLSITNARIIDGHGGILDDGTVVITDGRITSVSPGRTAVRGTDTIDARGMTVMPGFINTHWHIFSGTSVGSNEELDEYVERVVSGVLRGVLERGVTTIMSTGDRFPYILELRDKLAHGEFVGPRLLVVGPVFTAPDDWPTELCQGNGECQRESNAEVSMVEEARARVREVAAAGVDAVKLVYDNIIVPETRIADDVVAAIADEARLNGLTLLVHLTDDDVTVGRIVDLGARGFMHSDMQLDGEIAQLRGLRIPVATTVAHFLNAEEVSQVSDPAFTPQRDRFSLSLDNIRRLWNEGVTVAFGTDTVAGSDDAAGAGRFLTEARALNRVLSNEEVITALTQNAAKFVGLDDELGTLEPGKIADLVVIDGDPLTNIGSIENVRIVLQGGRIVVDHR